MARKRQSSFEAKGEDSKTMQKLVRFVQLTVLGIAAIGVGASSAQAQIKLPKPPKILGDKAKKADEAEVKANETVNKAKDAKNDPMKAAGSSTSTGLVGKPALAYDKPFPPTLLYQSLLDSLKVRENGDFIFNSHFKAVFLPDKEQGSGKEVFYGSHPSQHLLTGVLKKASGQKVGEMQFSGLPETKGGVFWVLKPVNVPFLKLQGEGDYVMEFAADGKVFYQFPFAVKKLAGNDPYKPGDLFYSDGAWNDYGYLTFEGDEKLVRWNMWLFDTGVKEGDDWKTVKVEVVKGGKVIALNDEKLDKTRVVKRNWLQRKYVVATSQRTPFSLKQLAVTDGAGELRVTVNGVLSVYPFTVKGGQVLPTGRAVREGTDPLRVIDGGGEAVFLLKKGATK